MINTDGEIIDGRLRGGLRPSPVTRDLTWGVPVPPTGEADKDMEKKVLCELSLRALTPANILLDVWVGFRIHF